MLEIRVLGQFEVRRNGAPVEIASRPAQTLLAYLALNSGIAHRREKIAGMLWPEADDRQARSNLRYTLWQIRKALGTGASGADRYLQADKISVTFLGETEVWLDAAELLRPEEGSGGSESLVRSLAHYRGELLPGFYEEWVLRERDRLDGLFDQRMNRLLESLMAEGRWAAVTEWAERWISQGNGPEPAYRALMHAHAALGDAAGLAGAYARCRETLQVQLGVEPSPQTVQLFQELSRREEFSRSEPAVSAQRTAAASAGERREPSTPGFLLESGAEESPRTFVGRQLELARLHSALSQAIGGAGKVVFVAGEAGQGKTALVEEFARQAEGQHSQLLVAAGKCDVSTGLGDPYLPFREVLAMLAGDVEARWSAGSIGREQAIRLWRGSRQTIEALVESAPELIGSFVPARVLRERLAAGPDADGTRSETILSRLERREESSGEEPPHRRRVYEAFIDLLTSIGERQPLLVVLDDLHWLDPSSADLLLQFARRMGGEHILIVGTYRPEDVSMRDGSPHPLAAVLAELKQIFGDVGVDLDQPSGPATRRLVDELVDLEPNRLGEEFRNRLAQWTGGHPLFVLEMLKNLQERGDLVRGGDGQWTEEKGLDWHVLPARVEGVIEERIARLDRELREALVIASVQGEVFTAEAITQVLGVDERALVRRLTRELEGQHRLVRELEMEQIGERRLSQFRFRHILIQRYLEQRLGQSERAYLHEALGKALEDLYGDQAERGAIRLARHFAEAARPDKAVQYLRLAGVKALRVSAYPEALGHLRRAESLLPPLADKAPMEERWSRAELEKLLGEALYGVGDLEASRGHLARALAGWGQPLPHSGKAVGWSFALELFRQGLHRLLPWRRGRTPGPESRARQSAASAYQLLVEIHVASQERALALLSSLRGLNLAESLGPCPELARAYADMTFLCPLLGLRGLAEVYRRRAQGTAQAVALDSVTAHVLLATSIYTVGEARWAESETSLDRAVELYRRLGDWNRLGLAMGVRTHVHVFRGEFLAFAQLHRDLEQLALRSGSFLYLAWSRDGQSEALLRQGAPGSLSEVVSRLEHSLAEISGKGFEAEETVVHGLLCQAYLRLGRLADVERSAAAAARLLARSPPTFYSFLEGVAAPYHGQLSIWEQTGTVPEAPSQRTRIRGARSLLRRFSRAFPLARPRLAVLEGLEAFLSGDRHGAYHKWKAASRLGRKLGMPREEAWAEFEMGRHLPPASAEAGGHLQEAARLFAAIGASYELGEAKRLAQKIS